MEISVAQLNNYIKSIFLSEEMLHNVMVIGEVDGLSVRGKGVWFTLKDKEAVISCVCWDSSKINVKNGDKVTVRGTVDYWNKAGKINFNVHAVVKSSAGDLLEQLKQLTEKLKAEGLFDKKRALPTEVKRIGVVTSKFGAVIQDIITVASRRNPNIDIVLYPVTVQGENAEREIIRGIEYFSGSKNIDIVILARGGGGAEDLAVFNLESIARCVAGCSVPIVSAIGHETDFTLADYVSDLRAPTPSAAAEIIVPEYVSKRDLAIRIWSQIKYIITSRLDSIASMARNFMNIFPKDFVAVSKNGERIKSVKSIKANDKLQICFADGKIGVTVDE